MSEQPTTAPAARLRAAATHLRALLADLGDCRGPWYIVNRQQRPYPQRIYNIGVPYVVASTTTDPSHPPMIADYIVTMHPGVGEALAAWLESAAALHEQPTRSGQTSPGCQWCADEDWPCSDSRHALAVADAILAGAEQ